MKENDKDNRSIKKWQKYGKMSKIVIFWQNIEMVLFDVFVVFVYGINVENVIFCRICMMEMWNFVIVDNKMNNFYQ